MDREAADTREEPTRPAGQHTLEAGVFNYGVHMTLDANPYEVGLGWLVNLDPEADFIGKNALSRIRAEGVSRKLLGVEIEGDPLDLSMVRWPIERRGNLVGFVTSAVWSPRMEKNLGYAIEGLVPPPFRLGLEA